MTTNNSINNTLEPLVFPFTAQTSVTCTHNLNKSFVSVNVVDNSGNGTATITSGAGAGDSGKTVGWMIVNPNS